MVLESEVDVAPAIRSSALHLSSVMQDHATSMHRQEIMAYRSPKYNAIASFVVITILQSSTVRVTLHYCVNVTIYVHSKISPSQSVRVVFVSIAIRSVRFISTITFIVGSQDTILSLMLLKGFHFSSCCLSMEEVATEASAMSSTD
jgi:hypothetical protein